MKKALGSLLVLSVLAFPLQAVVAQGAETELQKTQKALTTCNAILGNTIAKVMAAMPKLPPEKQKQVRQRVEAVEAEIEALDNWVESLDEFS